VELFQQAIQCHTGGVSFIKTEDLCQEEMKKPLLLILILIVSVFVVPVSTVAQSETECDPIQETEICIQEVSLSKTTVNVGNNTNIHLTIRNVGSSTGDAAILLGIRQPEGGYDHYRVEEVHNLESGQEQTVSMTVPFGEPAGIHELNIMVFDQAEQHLYDSTGYYHKVSVESKQSSFDIVGWFVSLGNVAYAALAIIALLIFLFSGRFVWG
jgi:hypothetical protein